MYNTFSLSKEDAFKLSAMQGIAITHRFFDEEEYILITPRNTVKFDSGAECPLEMFNADRKGDAWLTDWSIKDISQ